MNLTLQFYQGKSTSWKSFTLQDCTIIDHFHGIKKYLLAMFNIFTSLK